ncbi:MAG: hypothetical protein Q8L49_11425 [Burkholderiaceae bacterium]|nr:hypothetical protein [Burkholderiaceae bacterium]
MAQPDTPYLPPRGTYDVLFSVIKHLPSAGESFERTLGAAQLTGYQRPIRIKAMGLENLSRLTSLLGDVKELDDDEKKRIADQQAAKPGSTGGQLGALMSQLTPLLGREVERQKEVAKDALIVKLVEAGSPADAPGSVIVDVINPPAQVTGSIFGVKLNNKVRVTVTSDDFRPRVLLMLHRPKSMFSGGADDPTPEFSVVSNMELDAEGNTKVTVTYDRSVKGPEGTRGGPVIMVTSEDGKAVSGKYTIRYAQQ